MVMQLMLNLDDRLDKGAFKLAVIDERLRRHFGLSTRSLRRDPVSQLILALIGGRTRSAVSKRAFETLQSRFGAWAALRDAPVDQIQAAIRPVTFAEIKAPRLKAALIAITEAQGGLTLDSLADLPVEGALAWLERLPGVGRKAAAATLNVSTLRMRALVIDIHHLRVLRRLALVGIRSNLTQAYDRLMPLLPPDWSAAALDEHHQRMKRLGQTVCRQDGPLCHCCPLRDLCPSAACRF